MIVRLVPWRTVSGAAYSSGIALTVCILLLALASASGGCLNFSENSSNNLTPEDAAFLKTSNSLPMGKWDATIMAELTGDYQSMYQIAEAQKVLYEQRIQTLSPMPVSDLFADIKNEYCLADEYGMIACEYEMKRALALMESNYTAEDQYWEMENNAMDESLKHLSAAKLLYKARYDLS
jgi:hypothetical protein